MVEQLGHRVLAAHSGQAALDRAQDQRPDLVLLSLGLADLDSLEVCRRLGEPGHDPWLPVIVTSAEPGDEHFIRALRHGADDTLTLPANIELLGAKLRHCGRVLALQARLSGLAQRQRDIQDNILDPVVTLDASGRVETLNRAARQRFAPQGQGQAQVQGQACQDVLGVDLGTLLSQRECRLRQADGHPFEAEISLSPWHEVTLPTWPASRPGLASGPSDAAVTQAGSPAATLRYTLVLRDLTQRRQVDRMKDEFLATVSHELRTPLTSVLGALGLLAGGAAGPLPPAAAPLTEIARRNGERLSRLIDDILDLTKLEGDRLVLHLRPQALAPLLQEAVSANQAYAARAGVRLLGPDPTAMAGLVLPLDADRFLQVMANLLSNAIKHSPASGNVEISLSQSQGQVSISVRDHGPGIAEGFRGQMFEKFSQAEGGDRRVQGGTGLGLYISRMLVERMGGHITADAVPQGPGAVFSLHFPHGAPQP